jgi:hypothetical protein
MHGLLANSNGGPSFITLQFWSSWDQRGSCAPMLSVFLYSNFSLASSCAAHLHCLHGGPPADAKARSIVDNTRGRCDPSCVMFLHRFSQLYVFFRCPFTHQPQPGSVGVQDVDPSSATLYLRSTWHHRIEVAFRFKISDLISEEMSLEPDLFKRTYCIQYLTSLSL